MKKLLIYFAAGCLGALANSLIVWLAGEYSVTKALNVAIAPGLSPAWLYPRIVWGGLWGFLFLLPFKNTGLLLKGSILSLIPTAAQLFIVFPYQANKGMAGLELGLLTPLVVVVFNWVWGIVTAAAIKYAR